MRQLSGSSIGREEGPIGGHVAILRKREKGEEREEKFNFDKQLLYQVVALGASYKGGPSLDPLSSHSSGSEPIISLCMCPLYSPPTCKYASLHNW